MRGSILGEVYGGLAGKVRWTVTTSRGTKKCHLLCTSVSGSSLSRPWVSLIVQCQKYISNQSCISFFTDALLNIPSVTQIKTWGLHSSATEKQLMYVLFYPTCTDFLRQFGDLSSQPSSSWAECQHCVRADNFSLAISVPTKQNLSKDRHVAHKLRNLPTASLLFSNKNQKEKLCNTKSLKFQSFKGQNLNSLKFDTQRRL